MTRTISLLGARVETGTDRPGCALGPDALRCAGLGRALSRQGWTVRDLGDLGIPGVRPRPHANPAVHHLGHIVAWTAALADAAQAAARAHDLPIFLGGDHSISAGTVTGMARHAAEQGRPLFLLWLDAHPDLHDPGSTHSGNLHGTPLAYALGEAGFADFPPLAHAVDPANVLLMGLRSVDGAEARRIQSLGIDSRDMRRLEEKGVLPPLTRFLSRVRAANGLLHVSLDVDVLDPAIAPAVGTPVPGGVSGPEVHLIMEVLQRSGLVSALDLVELNPLLDVQGRTARLMVDLAASLAGARAPARLSAE
ncbi:arginase [Pseudooceanicola sp. HF7]|uniref:arginase n=1 Tax=Pseudooceanicola sp. HF7 TaxID=2721560 RepID=UPI00143016F8|nr:arginase [Pseudooceanicola sp. HF7]NIZ08452.1 arginase [Pseudooceanicola sp. HF7]